MGGHLLSGKSSGYMKKELHRHREDAGTALELLYEIVKKRPNLHFGVEKHLLE